MNGTVKYYLAWPQRRFWAAVGALFVVQVGLILLFNDRSQPRPPPSSPSFHFRALAASVSEDQLLRQFFAGDPAVLPLPNPRGFSGRGWLDEGPLAYQDTIQLEKPIWLEPTSLSGVPTSLSRFVSGMISNFGTDFLGNPSGTGSIPSERVEQPPSREDPWPVFLAPEVSPARSILRLQGGLIDRLLGGLPALQNWPGESLLTNSVVQIAVSPLGEVMAARLVTSCGLAEADSEAVNTARTLRFRAERSAGTKWGDAIFQWHMIEPAAVGPAK